MQISIRQNFRLNGTDHYTIFDLPIHVTNSIPNESNRPSCEELNNPLLDEPTLQASASNFTRIAGTAVQADGSGSGEGLGKPRPDAQPQDGLGGAGTLELRTGLIFAWVGIFAIILTL